MHGAAATPLELSARERARGSMRTSALNGSGARLGRVLLSRTLLRLLREVFLAFFVRRLVRRPGFLLRVNFSLPLCCAFLSCSFSFLCSLLCRPAGRRAEVASPPKRTVRSPRSILGRGHRVAVRSERTCRHKCECTREQCSDRPVHAVTPKAADCEMPPDDSETVRRRDWTVKVAVHVGSDSFNTRPSVKNSFSQSTTCACL
jgi:hypothetical protein